VSEMSLRVEKVALPDGRDVEVHLGNWEFGTDSPALVYHHGTPGHGNPGRHLLEAARDRGTRVIGPTRAGYSGSTRLPGRTIASVAADIEVVLDRLAIRRAMTLGVSGGGPHALATAALLQERIPVTASVAGMAPYGVPGLNFLADMGEGNLEEYGAAIEGEAALFKFLERESPALTQVSPEELGESMASLLPEVDKRLVTGDYAADLVDRFAQSLAPGVYGWLDDDLAFIAPWDFDLDLLSGRPVSIWQGGQDLMVPRAHGSWLASEVKGAQPRLLPEDGHLSIVVGRAGEIIDDLLANW
jgi:pimeloyl-ACP methyl ester carboxylesterase